MGMQLARTHATVLMSALKKYRYRKCQMIIEPPITNNMLFYCIFRLATFLYSTGIKEVEMHLLDYSVHLHLKTSSILSSTSLKIPKTVKKDKTVLN